MRRTDLEKRVGQIVILDLVSGQQIVTKLETVEADGYAITSAPWLQYAADFRPADPNRPPHPKDNPFGWRIGHAKYGTPVFAISDHTPIAADHIICVHDCPKELEALYLKEKSGIVLANESVLTQLDAANKPRRK